VGSGNFPSNTIQTVNEHLNPDTRPPSVAIGERALASGQQLLVHNAVPVPATMILFGGGLAAIAARRLSAKPV
jgi:hypothetical protein